MDAVAALRPLAGPPEAVVRLVSDWLSADSATPLSVRTSGSSGEPKEVALSAGAVTASARAASSRLGGPGQWVLALPVHHVAGLQVVVRSVLAGTRPVLLADHPDLASASRTLTHRRRYLSIVPTQLHRMLASPTDTEALTGFDAVLLGGSAARADLLDEARRHHVAVVTTYGMSETCGGCVYDGIPLDGVSVSTGEDSRVMISGPVLFDGYVDEPALTAEVMRDGWLRTPDIGRIDDEGRLRVLGRADDVVVSGGVNVSLAAVARRLVAHPSIRDAVAVGVPDAEWGARVVAVAVLEPGADAPSLSDVRDFVGAIHPREWAPRGLVVVAALPMLESGKVDRRAVMRTVGLPRG